MSDRYFLGVDGGGTKTDFVLFKEDGTVVDSFRFGTGNPTVVGFDTVQKMLQNGIRKCLSQVQKIESCFLGIAGDEQKRLVKPLEEEFPDIIFFEGNDAVNVLEDNDIGIIMGTGSMVVLRERNGIRTIGGYGCVIGDPASGFSFGKEAIKAVLEAEDGLENATLLKGPIREKLNVPDGARLYDYYGPFCRSEAYNVARLSEVVFDCAKQGDKVANGIVETEVQSLMRQVNAALKASSATRVSVGGGVAVHNQELLFPLMKKYAIKEVELCCSDLPPVYGACLECMKESSVEICKNFRENFSISFR